MFVQSMSMFGKKSANQEVVCLSELSHIFPRKVSVKSGSLHVAVHFFTSGVELLPSSSCSLRRDSGTFQRVGYYNVMCIYIYICCNIPRLQGVQYYHDLPAVMYRIHCHKNSRFSSLQPPISSTISLKMVATFERISLKFPQLFRANNSLNLCCILAYHLSPPSINTSSHLLSTGLPRNGLSRASPRGWPGGRKTPRLVPVFGPKIH